MKYENNFADKYLKFQKTVEITAKMC